MTLLRKCPECDSYNTARSHRKVWEFLLPFKLKPYRCGDCQRRFYSSVSNHDMHL